MCRGTGPLPCTGNKPTDTTPTAFLTTSLRHAGPRSPRRPPTPHSQRSVLAPIRVHGGSRTDTASGHEPPKPPGSAPPTPAPTHAHCRSDGHDRKTVPTNRPPEPRRSPHSQSERRGHPPKTQHPTHRPPNPQQTPHHRPGTEPSSRPEDSSVTSGTTTFLTTHSDAEPRPNRRHRHDQGTPAFEAMSSLAPNRAHGDNHRLNPETAPPPPRPRPLLTTHPEDEPRPRPAPPTRARSPASEAKAFSTALPASEPRSQQQPQARPRDSPGATAFTTHPDAGPRRRWRP